MDRRRREKKKEDCTAMLKQKRQYQKEEEMMMEILAAMKALNRMKKLKIVMILHNVKLSNVLVVRMRTRPNLSEECIAPLRGLIGYGGEREHTVVE